MSAMNTTLVFVPTYNERENVPLLYRAIKEVAPDVDLLFLDDNSPDGTGAEIDRLAMQDSTVHTIHREGKQGLGTAHVRGFAFAREKGYRYLITMDADFTHDPKYIPELRKHIHDADIVIGSRYVAGGQMKEWGTVRRWFTLFWRNCIRYGLGLSHDCTGAYRMYNVEILKPSVYAQFDSAGFPFCMESLYRFSQCGARIKEIPIQAFGRKYGATKLSVSDMYHVQAKFFKLVVDRATFGKQRFTKNVE